MVRAAAFLAATLPLAHLIAAVPSKRQSDSNACSRLARAWEENGSNSRPAQVQPSVAYECLRSVPVDKENDIGLIEYLTPWLGFQSTIGILADPPAGYMYPGVDIFAGLRNITERLENDDYDNQYDFVLDIYRLINVKPREGHLTYRPALVNVIQFQTRATFISISEDGTSLPSVYLYADYLLSRRAGYEPSEVESFEDTPITQWLQQRGVDNDKCQDPDASYNTQLYSAALDNIGVSSGAVLYMHTELPDTSPLKFSNGTEVEVPNAAFLVGNFSGIASGQDVHERFEVPDRQGRPQADPLTDGPPGRGFVPDLEGYPEPFIKHPANYISGYHFADGELADTAIIAVKSFLSPAAELSFEEDFEAFATVVGNFTLLSQLQNKERLIIDFQGNGGGALANLLVLYATLFPGADIRLPLRARGNDLLNWMGSTAEDTGIDMFPTFDIDFSVDEDLNRFRNWDALYDLETILGDEFTQVYQPRELRMLELNAERLAQQAYFEPNNTVIVTDGFCASACAIAVGLMSRVLGIQVIAMGGRPIEAPMQAVGGTKGGPVLDMFSPKITYQRLSQRSSPPQDLDATPFETAGPPLAGPPAEFAVVNSANVHLPDDDAGTPLQFIYEAANCKLFYTWDTLTNLTALWNTVSDVKWNSGSCVSGSTTNNDDSIGDGTPEFSQNVVSNFTWAEGPGDVSDSPPGGTPSGSGGGGNGNGNNGGSPNNNDNAASRLGGMVFSVVASVLVAAIVYV